MIDIKEIRLKNWVKWTEASIQLTESDIAYLFDMATKGQKCETYQPIPLSESWLERAGYQYYNGKKDGDMTMDFGGKLDIDWIMGTIRVKSHFETDTLYRELKHIQYVHQLQNLYWCLCGKELEFRNL